MTTESTAHPTTPASGPTTLDAPTPVTGSNGEFAAVALTPSPWRSPVQAARAHLRDPLFAGTYLLILTVAAQALSGLVFWIIAAQLFDNDTVGRDAALLAAGRMISTLCQFNLFSSLPRWLTRLHRPERLIKRSYALTGAASAVASFAFLLIAPHVSSTFNLLRDDPMMAAAYVAGVAVWTIISVQDAALIGLRYTRWVAPEALIFGLAQIGLLIVFSNTSVAYPLILAFFLPAAVLLVPMGLVLFRGACPKQRQAHPPDGPDSIGRGELRFNALDYSTSLLWPALWGILPLVIVARIGTAANAHAAAAVAIGAALRETVGLFGVAYTVEAARERGRNAVLLRRTARAAVPLTLLPATAGLILAPFVLRLFGADYARTATTLLRTMALAIVGAAMAGVAVAHARLRQNFRPLIVINLIAFVVTLALVFLWIDEHELAGVGWAILASHSLFGLVSYLYVRSELKSLPTLHDAPDVTPLPKVRSVKRPLAFMPRAERGLMWWLLVALVPLAVVAAQFDAGPLRTVVMLACVLLLPGAPLMRRVVLPSPSSFLAMAFGVSLATWTLVALVSVATEQWYPWRILGGIAAFSILTLLLERPRESSILPSRPTDDDDDTSSSQRRRVFTLTHVLLTLGAAGCAVDAARRLNPSRASTFGLAPALPITYFVGAACVIVGFALALFTSRPKAWLLATYVVLLVAFLHGVATFAEVVPRYSWSYRHIGVEQFIFNTGSIDPNIDAYHNWPGFFAVGATFTKLVDMHPLQYATWAQVFFNLLTVPTILFIARSFTEEVRLRWLTVLFFILGNWVGNDYYAPQALGFYLAFTAVAITLWLLSRFPKPRKGTSLLKRVVTRLWSRTTHLRPDLPSYERSAVNATQQRAAVLVILLVFTALVPTHQLTPLLVIMIYGMLVLLRRVRQPWIFIAMLELVAGLWWIFARTYLQSDSTDTQIQFGTSHATGPSASSGLTELSNGLRWVILLSAVHALLIWFVAGTGILRRLRAGFSDVEAYVVTFTPLFAVPFIAYGGEIALRVYLFSLPGAAYLAAASVLPRYSSWRRRSSFVATIGIATALCGLFLFSAYGRESFNYIRPGELEVVKELERVGTPDSALVMVAPRQYGRQTENYYYFNRTINGVGSLLEIDDVSLTGRVLSDADVASAIAVLSDQSFFLPTYVLFTVSQERYIESYGLMPAGEYARLEQMLRNSGRFETLASNQDGTLLRLTYPANPPPPVISPDQATADPPTGVAPTPPAPTSPGSTTPAAAS